MRLVPNIPLLWIALVVGVPASSWIVYAAGAPGLSVFPGVAALALAFLAALLDLLRSSSRLAGLSVTVPDLLRCTKGRELAVPVTLVNAGAPLPSLRYGIATPPDFRAAGELVARITGLEAEDIRQLARRLVETRSMVTVSWSLQRAQHGEQPYWAALGHLAAAAGRKDEAVDAFRHALLIAPSYGVLSNLGTIQYEAGRYATTLHIGSYKGLGDTWARLMGEWLPKSGERLAQGVSYEIYRNAPGDVPEAELRTELYMPLAD